MKNKKKIKINNNLKNAAFSFVEMLVAITILIFAVSFIIAIFSSNNAEREKVLNYYAAMSIANKIIEDIDNTIRENPYYLSEIIKYDKKYKIMSINAPFFSNIEDFDFDGKLNDKISDYAANFDLKKIKDFEYSIKISEMSGFEGLGEHIAQVTVNVEWPEGKRTRNYSFSTIFSGTPIIDNSSEIEFQTLITAGTTARLKAALNSNTADLKVYAADLGDDYESLYNLGLISVFTDSAKEFLQKIDIEIQNIKSGASADIYSRLSLAKLYEKKSIALMQNFNCIKFPASDLLKRLKNGEFKIDGFAAASNTHLLKIKNNIGLLRKNDPMTGLAVTDSHINAFSESIHSAFLIYLNLLSDPVIDSSLNLRERQAIFLKIIDLGSALILNKNENIIVNIGNYPLTIKQTVKNTLRNLQMYYELRNTARAKYIETLLAKLTSGLKLPSGEELEKKYDDLSTLSKFCEHLYSLM